MPAALASARVDEGAALDNATDTRLQRDPRVEQLKEEALKVLTEEW